MILSRKADFPEKGGERPCTFLIPRRKIAAQRKEKRAEGLSTQLLTLEFLTKVNTDIKIIKY